jgi:sulfate permease, SulP family
VLACLFFIYRVSSLTAVEPVQDQALPPGCQAYRVFGSLFFGSIGKIEALLDAESSQSGEDGAAVMVLDLHHVINVDTTGLDSLDMLRRTLAKRGAQLVLADVSAQPLSLMKRSGFLPALGEDNLTADLVTALARARQLLPAASPAASA